MAQTIQNYNMEFGSGKRMPATSRQGTVLTGQGVLAINTLLMLNSAGKYVKGDTNATPANTTEEGWSILLEEVDTTSGDVDAEIGVTGEIGEDTIVFAGTNLTAINETARVILAMNNIFVNKYDNSVANV